MELGQLRGYCAWRDSDGDKIFNSYTGNLAASGVLSGLNQIIDGTGKFKGIQGKAPFQCTALSDKGQYACTQQFRLLLKQVDNRRDQRRRAGGETAGALR